MSRRRPGTVIAIGALTAVVLTALSLVVLAASGASSHHRWFGASSAANCTPPTLTGTVVDVSLMNMGGPMMGGNGGMMTGGMMRLITSTATVPAGTVSFRVLNAGTVVHELVVLPLPNNQIVGTRPVGANGQVDETGSLGEASKTCGAGGGDGIAPGSASWVTLTLPAGRYELVCNLPGHYAAGMYAQLVVQ